ncbi:hypothetical protein [Sphingomonas sp.]|uniref:hypothetical protein n=1 Tax=Sphingomonas sp. TaxID=28214 RepID=UPI001DF01BFF|nr:hypothetical protein [Sphingomonas sp.]MBX9795914.1 hypothetical protein [Sphingomonas sp.]
MSEVDRQIERSAELLNRTARARQAPVLRERQAETGRRMQRALLLDAVILIAATIATMAGLLGVGGWVLTFIVMLVATMVMLAIPTRPAPRAEQLARVPLKALPAQTGRWLETQRPALPAPAVQLIDTISTRLDTLALQLDRLPEEAPAATELRKLLGEQLPEFVKGYAQVPPALRRAERNGTTPDAQLVEGLKLIDQEIGEMTEQLAQGDLDSLATHGRFLELKYRGDAA